jgi:hypothetical protein
VKALSQNESRPTSLFIAVACVTAVYSIFSAVLMTEPGQNLDLPRAWIVAYYANRWVLIGLNVALLVAFWYLHAKVRLWRNVWVYLASVGVVLCIVAANFLLPAFFPSYQHGAQYVSVQEADEILQDDEIIYAVELNGDVKGYPRKHLEIPHIAGANIGGEDVIMTFCALSNLPVVYDQDIGSGESDLGILIQVHNNLLMVDRESGDLVQQITGEVEFSGNKLQARPNDMMTWAVFKSLHPDGEVFVYEFNRPLDAFLLAVFEGPMERQFSEEHGAVFPTLDLKDTRLLHKEQVWGLDVGGEQAAFTRGFMVSNPIYQFELGGQSLVIAYDSQYDIVTLFDRTLDGTAIDIAAIDRQGNTPAGKLRKMPLHNGVFWMVWAHWFPETKVFS